ncbi:MAG TPA: hypothetical protein VMI31_07015 [Fimbriimonadaceae bacterium]|nr:hypothetical protein [Fimbriimonadaceae bacterium]
MKSTRAITVGVTFIAGLYFILDFVVPPTLPVASTQGVVAGTTPASFSARSGALAPATYRFAGPDDLRPHVLLSELDIFGKEKLQPVLLRQIGPGSIVTVRIGPFTAKSIRPDGIVETMEGDTVALAPGQRWIDGGTDAPVSQPEAGMSLAVEQSDAKVVTIDPGAIELLAGGTRVNHPLGSKTVVMKIARYGPGSEVREDELRVGDTARIGPETLFADYRDTAAQFNLVITTMAFGIGLISLGMVHSRSLAKRGKGWYVSIFFFVALILGVMAGLGKYEDPGAQARAFSDFIVLKVIAAASSTMFSLLAFYMAIAAYRAFRVKTGEAALMMVSALIVMIGQTPFGTYLTSWMGERYSALWLPNIAAWILRVPNTAMFRGLIFGLMLGAIGTALRYWLSMEKAVSAGE